MTEKRPYGLAWLFFAVTLLLVIAASRIFRLQEMIELGVDELWSVWQTFGTPQQILQWTPYDWPPLYYLLLGGWRALVGLHPAMLRYLAVLVFMLACAVMIRLMQRLGVSRWNVLLGMLAFAAPAYSVFVSLYVRGYMLVALFAPLSLWLTLRYFERPTLRRALPLGLTLAAMFLTTLSVIGTFVALGIFSVVVYRKQIWRWWLPGIIAGGLALPEIISKLSLSVRRVSATSQQQLPPFGEALWGLFEFWTADAVVVWIAVILVASLLLILRKQLNRKAVGALLWLFTPALLYFFNDYIGLFMPYRYTAWAMVGLALWLGLGLSQLPRPGRVVAGGVLLGLAFLPIPTRSYEYFSSSFGNSIAWLADHMQAGDVILIDPNWQDPLCGCRLDADWDYYSRVFFPDGMPFVDAPEGHRRVWYVTWQSRQDPEMEARVNTGRIPGIFVGPPEVLFRLYEGPPDSEGIRFENGLRFHGIEFVDTLAFPIAHEGESLQVRLWWATDEVQTADYSISLQVFFEGELVFQQDGPVKVDGIAQETSQWEPGRLYLDERTIDIPYPAVQGNYEVKLTVYQWWDNVRLNAPGVDADRLLPVGNIHVKSW
ncbi:MAG: hypothetical protein Kow0077_12880 [Anaerolineae bacterium]